MQQSWRFWTGVGASILFAISYYSSAHIAFVSLISYPALITHARIVTPITHWFADRKTNQELKHTIFALQTKCTLLERALSRLQAQRAYLNGSKELHAFNKRFNLQGRVAKILAKSLTDTDQFFLIDMGSNENVQKDTIVLYNNAVVGKVVEVYPLHSKICLITDAQCKMGAYTAPDRAQGIHEGCNATGQTQLKYVDHLSHICKGDTVLTSGKGLLFPEGYTLGTVSKVVPDGLYQQVTLAPACDFERIEYCMLLPK